MSANFAIKTGRVAAGGSLLVGGVAGAVVFPSLGYGTHFIPALFTGLAAAVYTVGQLRSRPRASV